jgi:hypothetical protein
MTKPLPKKTDQPAKPLPKKPDQRSIRVESGDVFVIQKNIPVVGAYRSLGPSLRYPFDEMLPGESFEMKATKNDMKKVVSRASSAAASFVKKNNKAAKFTVRRTGPDTCRVWRLK